MYQIYQTISAAMKEMLWTFQQDMGDELEKKHTHGKHNGKTFVSNEID